jgi:hypothetical protein
MFALLIKRTIGLCNSNGDSVYVSDEVNVAQWVSQPMDVSLRSLRLLLRSYLPIKAIDRGKIFLRRIVIVAFYRLLWGSIVAVRHSSVVWEWQRRWGVNFSLYEGISSIFPPFFYENSHCSRRRLYPVNNYFSNNSTGEKQAQCWFITLGVGLFPMLEVLIFLYMPERKRWDLIWPLLGFGDSLLCCFV